MTTAYPVQPVLPDTQRSLPRSRCAGDRPAGQAMMFVHQDVMQYARHGFADRLQLPIARQPVKAFIPTQW